MKILYLYFVNSFCKVQVYLLSLPDRCLPEDVLQIVHVDVLRIAHVMFATKHTY